MAEELKGQVGEHIPTVIPLMAQAMGMDVKTLFKTMEKGELDPMTALPKLAALMKQQSDPAMADFRKTLPYWQGMAQVRQEQWMTQFNASGGSRGFTQFWKVWTQLIEDSQNSATVLGNAFEKISGIFNAAMLIPMEFVRWSGGEDDIRNFWQRMFGDFPKEDFEQFKNTFSNFKTVLITVFGDVGVIAKNIIETARILSELNTGGSSDWTKMLNDLLNAIQVVAISVSKSIRGVSEILKGNFAEGMAQLRQADMSLINSQLQNQSNERSRKDSVSGSIISKFGVSPSVVGLTDPGFTITKQQMDMYNQGVPVLNPQGTPYTRSEMESGYSYGQYLSGSQMSSGGVLQHVVRVELGGSVSAMVEARTDAEAIGKAISDGVTEKLSEAMPTIVRVPR